MTISAWMRVMSSRPMGIRLAPLPPAWGPVPVVAAPAARTTTTMATRTRLSQQGAGGDDRVPRPGAVAGPEGQDHGHGQQGHPHHEVGHDHIGVELASRRRRPRARPRRCTPRMSPPDSHRRSRRAGRRRNAATTVTAQATTSTKTTTRLPNSTSGWRLRAGVSWCCEQVGQSGQPEPRVGQAHGGAGDDVEDHGGQGDPAEEEERARADTQGGHRLGMVPARPGPAARPRPAGARPT